MSHIMDMTVKNDSSQTLTKCDVTHTWDKIENSIDAPGLNPGNTTPIQTITSGYTEYDWYQIKVKYSDGTSLVTRFYCNSSHAEDAVQIKIKDGAVCDCVYFEKGQETSTCNNKG